MVVRREAVQLMREVVAIAGADFCRWSIVGFFHTGPQHFVLTPITSAVIILYLIFCEGFRPTPPSNYNFDSDHLTYAHDYETTIPNITTQAGISHSGTALVTNSRKKMFTGT